MKMIQDVRRDFEEWAMERMLDIRRFGEIHKGCSAEMADVFVSRTTRYAYHGYMAGYVDGHNSNAKPESVSIED